MTDEIYTPDLSNEKTTLTSEDQSSSDELLQPIEDLSLSNGDEHHGDVQTTDDQDINLSSHIQPADNSDQTTPDQSIEQTESSETSSSEPSFTPESPDQSNLPDQQNQDENNSLVNNEQLSDLVLNFIAENDPQQLSDQTKAQREIDEDEIPPADVRTDPTIISNEKRNSTSEVDTQQIDDRPLTALETPFEHHPAEPSPSVESSNDQIFENSVNETNVETSSEHVAVLSASSMSEIVTENFEENVNELTNELNESENDFVEETRVQEEAHFTEEDFPPLTPSTTTLDHVPTTGSNNLTEEDFPPLASSTTTTLDQVLTTESNHLNNNNHPLSTQSNLPEREDILKNKTLFKQTLVEGIPNTAPTRSTLVTISYTLSTVDTHTSNVRIIEQVANERYFVSEYDLIPAIDICLQKMNRGERATIECDLRHCYGEKGCEEKSLPPSTTLNPYEVKIDLELHDWQNPPDVQTLTIDERLYWGDKKRQMGNFYYRRQDYQTSLQSYKGALRFLETDYNTLPNSIDQTQRSILNDRYIQVQNNLAQVNLHLGNHQACLNAVENVLRYDPKNVKALFRQGKALFELGKYDQALVPLKLFSSLQRGNSTTNSDNDKVNEIISICENKLASYQKNEKEIYRRMFQPATNQQAKQNIQNKNQIPNTNSNWWPYLALGSAVLATVGFVTFLKYRKVA